ncbi:LIM domain-binding protein 2a isoform X1 [Tachysurus ichikawai]
MSNPAHDPFYASPFGPFYRRHAPYAVQPEYRIYELNKRLQARTEVSSPRGVYDSLDPCVCARVCFVIIHLNFGKLSGACAAQ